MPQLVDAHAHLADVRLKDRLPQILDECARRGVTRILVNAALPEEWPAVVELSRMPGIYGALGLHPFFPERWSNGLMDDLRAAIRAVPADGKIVAIGEIGLDAWDGRDTLAVQTTMFRAQVELAQELALPVAIHNRRTWADFFQVVKALGLRRLRGYCHHFTGSPDVLEKVLSLGLMVSYCGPATTPNARKIHAAIQLTPLESLLTETDCPDLPPIQAGAVESMPWHTGFVLDKIAELKGVPADELALQVQRNFDRLFL